MVAVAVPMVVPVAMLMAGIVLIVRVLGRSHR
jgi:hypothetical protein